MNTLIRLWLHIHVHNNSFEYMYVTLAARARTTWQDTCRWIAYCKCEWIWEKGLLHAEAEFFFLIAHNFKAVIATDLKPSITILQSLHYARCKFCAPPTSSLGAAIASITCSQKLAILCLSLVPHHFRLEDRAGVPINWSLRLLVSSSYDRLKTVKFWRFARSGPFSQIRSQMTVQLHVSKY